MGSIQIDPEVIAMYAGTTAVECFGIVGMAAVSMNCLLYTSQKAWDEVCRDGDYLFVSAGGRADWVAWEMCIRDSIITARTAIITILIPKT